MSRQRRAAPSHAFAHALVVGHLDAVARVVAHAHPPPAAGADRQALQQRRAFPCRALVPLAAVRLGVTQQCGLVGLVLFEADISRVRVRDEREPLLARHGDHGLLAGGRVAGFAALPVDERAGIARVVQGAQHPPVPQRHPRQLTLVGALADADREQQPGGVELGHDRAGGAGAGEGGEQVRDRLAHADVGVEHDLVCRIIGQPDRQAHLQFAAAGLGQLPAAQPGADEVQLGLAHRAFEAEQQPVIELAGVIEPVLVADQGARQRADLQQPVPVGVVAGQAGDLQAEHDPGPAHADVGDQALEPFSVGGRRP